MKNLQAKLQKVITLHKVTALNKIKKTFEPNQSWENYESVAEQREQRIQSILWEMENKIETEKRQYKRMAEQLKEAKPERN